MRPIVFKFTFIIALSSLIISQACKSKSQVQATTQTEPVSCKVIISFASRGTGIDYNKHDSLISLLNEKKLKFTEKVMGREGEKEVCIPLSEMGTKQKTEFIDRLKKFDNQNTLVSVSVN